MIYLPLSVCSAVSCWLKKHFDSSQVFVSSNQRLFSHNTPILIRSLVYSEKNRPISFLSEIQSARTKNSAIIRFICLGCFSRIGAGSKQETAAGVTCLKKKIQMASGSCPFFFRRDVLTWETCKPGFACRKEARIRRGGGGGGGGPNHIAPGVAAAPIIKRKNI